MRKGYLLAIVAGNMLAGCSSIPAIAPTLAYRASDCVDTPDTSQAISLTPDKDKAVWTLDADLSSNGPCLFRDDRSSPYLVFSLPGEGKAKMVEIGSVLEEARVVSPQVVLLDATGRETRVLARDIYMFRPGLFSVQFVPRPTERYAMVTVDQELVGKTHETLVSSIKTQPIYSGIIGSNFSRGHEAMMSRGFSYEGPVRALVYRSEDQD